MDKTLGQYFTIDISLQQRVYDLVKNKHSLLLEPSFGAGHLLKKFKTLHENYPMYCYEIDDTIVPEIDFNSHQKVFYGDFLTVDIVEKFPTIIGNPPYVKSSGMNLYIKFIDKCYKLLSDGGELIFIVPSDFLKLTSASKVISSMCSVGSFTHFYFPNNEKLFSNASIDVVIFRYEKGLMSNHVIVNDVEKYCKVSSGIITFSDEETQGKTLSDYFDVCVGLVSGRDEVYKVPIGNRDILVDEDKVEKYIYVSEFPSGDISIDEHLLKHKDTLLSRQIRKFNENNWFEWGAPRNIKLIEENFGRPCIYVRNITRKECISFIGKVQYFGGKLLCLIPHGDIDLDKVVSYLNSEQFKTNYIYSGRFKIGHRQLCLSILPI